MVSHKCVDEYGKDYYFHLVSTCLAYPLFEFFGLCVCVCMYFYHSVDKFGLEMIFVRIFKHCEDFNRFLLKTLN